MSFQVILLTQLKYPENRRSDRKLVNPKKKKKLRFPEECEEKVLPLKDGSRYATAIADEVIGCLQEAQRIMAVNLGISERPLAECEKKSAACLGWLTNEETDDNKKFVEEESEKLFKAILYRHAFVDPVFFSSRHYPAGDARH